MSSNAVGNARIALARTRNTMRKTEAFETISKDLHTNINEQMFDTNAFANRNPKPRQRRVGKLAHVPMRTPPAISST